MIYPISRFLEKKTVQCQVWVFFVAELDSTAPNDNVSQPCGNCEEIIPAFVSGYLGWHFLCDHGWKMENC